MGRKLIVNDGRKERELLLVGTMVVGRDPTCDISAVDPLLSRRHVEFVSDSRRVLFRDLGSRNGILVNGVKATQGSLRTGDLIQIGHLQVKFVEDDAPLVVPPDAGGDPDATVMASQPRPLGTTLPAPAAAEEEFDRTLAPVRKPEATGAASSPVPRPVADLSNLDRTVATIQQPPAPAMRAQDLDKTQFVPPPAMTTPARPAANKTAVAPPAATARTALTHAVADREEKTAQIAAPLPHELGRAPALEMLPFLAPGDRIRFDYPKKDWQLVSGGTVAVVTLAQKNGQAAIVVEETRMNQALAPEDVTDLFAQLEADAVKRQPAAADVQAKLVAVDGRRFVIVTYTRRGVSGPERVRQYSIPAGADLYRLTCSAAATLFARYEPVFAHVAASFATTGRTD